MGRAKRRSNNGRQDKIYVFEHTKSVPICGVGVFRLVNRQKREGKCVCLCIPSLIVSRAVWVGAAQKEKEEELGRENRARWSGGQIGPFVLTF